MEINPKTQAFIYAHRLDDVAALALRGCTDAAVDMPLALRQIEGWQIARRKLPSWAACIGLIYPPKLSLEQCSSEQTAGYKAEIVARLVANGLCGTTSMADLTGGFGVDFSFISRRFRHKVYVEQQEQLCQVAETNFRLLGLENVKIVNKDATDYLQAMERVDFAYIDPARRDEKGRRTYSISACRPDVSALAPLLLQKSGCVMVKLSPMLDWHEAASELPCVTEVHIVAAGGECKELLLILISGHEGEPVLTCVNDGLAVHPVESVPQSGLATPPYCYLYEPNAALMKSGCFGWVASTYGVGPVGPNSHLFVSATPVVDFPGRGFSIEAVTSLSKKDLRRNLSSIGRANITVRNFPLTAVQLRKRLKLADGGNVYIFATTTADGRHVLFVCRKLIS